MASFYGNAQATATKLLTKYGSPAAYVIERTTGATLDPVAGTYSGGSVTSTTQTGIATKLPKTLIDGTRILATDHMYIFDSSFAPLMDDTLIDNGNRLKIISIIPVKPADAVILYKVIARG
jgi:hypothetical protein